MQIIAQPDRVMAGRVTFDVENQSKELIHEMLLLKQPSGGSLPYDSKTRRVVEAKIVKSVDVDDIKPGASVRKTVTLQSGVDEMICNEPGYYHCCVKNYMKPNAINGLEETAIYKKI